MKFTMGDAWGIAIGLLLGTLILAGVSPMIHAILISIHPWEALGNTLLQNALYVIVPAMMLAVIFMMMLMMRGSRRNG